jgi:transglutaminase/protease-like cytokinesis protein 3
MGFMSHQIVGYSKGIGYQHGEAILKDDHAWNVVKIFGEWFLLDVTWSGCREVGG